MGVRNFRIFTVHADIGAHFSGVNVIFLMLDDQGRKSIIKGILANSVDPDKTSQNVPFDQGLQEFLNNKMACAPSEDSNQLGHPPSLMGLHCALNR